MLYLLNGINEPVVYVLIVLLILIVVAIFYLIYVQHKEIVSYLSKNNNKTIKSEKDNIQTNNSSNEMQLPSYKENNQLEIIDPLITKIDEDIPDKFDYTKALWKKDDFDIETLSKNLENRDTAIKNRDAYEEEQEEQAIISYDELKRKSLKQEEKIELPIKKQIVEENEFVKYEHEEIFLNELKKLKNILK